MILFQRNIENCVKNPRCYFVWIHWKPVLLFIYFLLICNSQHKQHQYKAHIALGCIDFHSSMVWLPPCGQGYVRQAMMNRNEGNSVRLHWSAILQLHEKSAKILVFKCGFWLPAHHWIQMRLISTVMISRNAAIAKLHFAEALLSWCSGKTQLFSHHLQEQLDTAAQG